jgi:hypothetical protein
VGQRMGFLQDVSGAEVGQWPHPVGVPSYDMHGPVLCGVGGAGVAGGALACGESWSGVGFRDVEAAQWTLSGVMPREAWRRAW